MHVAVTCWETDEQELNRKLTAIDNPDGLILFGQYEFDYMSQGNLRLFDRLVNFSNQKNIPLYLVTGGTKENGIKHDASLEIYKNVQPIIYWETFWINQCYIQYNKKHCGLLDIDDLDTGRNLNDFKYRFISMNHRYKYHRCCLLDYIAKNDLLDGNSVSFHYHAEEETRSRSNFYNWKYWNPHYLSIDYPKTTWMEFHGQGHLPIQYIESFMQVVSESSTDFYILSEKAAAPLFFNKLFLVQGPKGFHAMLERLGFVLYDEIFDYSFDQIENIETRTDMMLQNVVNLKRYTFKELKEVYIRMYPKIRHNKQRILELNFSLDFVPKFLLERQLENDSCFESDELARFMIQMVLNKNQKF